MKLIFEKHWPKMHQGANFGEGQRSCKGQYRSLKFVDVKFCFCDNFVI